MMGVGPLFLPVFGYGCGELLASKLGDLCAGSQLKICVTKIRAVNKILSHFSLDQERCFKTLS
jgi:hypothetical protein